MKKVIFRIIMLVMFFLLLYPLCVFADAKTVITNVAESILAAVAWFGYAIALCATVYVGIKYAMSGAEDRANLKGIIPKYLIGLALIILCSAIAQGVAKIAGNEGADAIIEAGKNAGAKYSTGGTQGILGGGWTKIGNDAHKNIGNIVVTARNGATVSEAYSTEGEGMFEMETVTLTASETDGNGNKFVGWRMSNQGNNNTPTFTGDGSRSITLYTGLDASVMPMYDNK